MKYFISLLALIPLICVGEILNEPLKYPLNELEKPDKVMEDCNDPCDLTCFKHPLIKSISDYGAIANDGIDDSAAIRAAARDLSFRPKNAPRSILVFPKGHYIIDEYMDNRPDSVSISDSACTIDAKPLTRPVSENIVYQKANNVDIIGCESTIEIARTPVRTTQCGSLLGEDAGRYVSYLSSVIPFYFRDSHNFSVSRFELDGNVDTTKRDLSVEFKNVSDSALESTYSKADTRFLHDGSGSTLALSFKRYGNKYDDPSSRNTKLGNMMLIDTHGSAYNLRTGFSLGFNSDNGDLWYRVGSSNSWIIAHTEPGVLNDFKEHVVVVRFDTSRIDNHWSLYLDGIKLQEGKTVGGRLPDTGDSYFPISVGGRVKGYSPGSLDGRIYGLVAYNSYLSDDDIGTLVENMRSNSVPVPHIGMPAIWHMADEETLSVGSTGTNSIEEWRNKGSLLGSLQNYNKATAPKHHHLIVESGSHGFYTKGSSNYHLEDMSIHHFAADGIHLGGGLRIQEPNENQTEDTKVIADRNASLSRVHSFRNARQGISVIQVAGLLIRDSIFELTGRTEGSYGSHAPSAGIDIEPDQSVSGRQNNNGSITYADTPTTDIVIKNSRFEHNIGIQIIMGDNTEKVGTVKLENCLVTRDEESLIYAIWSRVANGLITDSFIDTGAGRISILTNHPNLNHPPSHMTIKDSVILSSREGVLASRIEQPSTLLITDSVFIATHKEPAGFFMPNLATGDGISFENNTIEFPAIAHPQNSSLPPFLFASHIVNIGSSKNNTFQVIGELKDEQFYFATHYGTTQVMADNYPTWQYFRPGKDAALCENKTCWFPPLN